MTETLIERMVARWTAPGARPLFRGRLIDADGRCCAQGDVLRVCGISDDSLRSMKQTVADRRVAEALGISLTHSILLRQVNDSKDGCPQDVLAHPERVLSPEAPRILAFWRHLDLWDYAGYDPGDNAGDVAAFNAARSAAIAVAGSAPFDIAFNAASDAGWDVGWHAAWATSEIQGASKLEKFFFLPLFGIGDPTKLAPISAL